MSEAVESPVAAAFDAIAEDYDREWTDSLIGRAQRRQVWECLAGLFLPGERVLELGCGTGADAVWWASQRVRVDASDISPAMVEKTRARAEAAGVGKLVTARVLAIEDLPRRAGGSEVPAYDGVFSNFGALNCLEDLVPLAQGLEKLVRPGGRVALCFMGRFCLWETCWHLLHAKPGKAFRRFRASGAAAFSRGGRPLRVRYPTVAELRRALGKSFRLQRVYGVGICVPPSYLESVAQRHPRLVDRLARVDHVLKQAPGLRAISDHRLVVWERVA